MKIPQPKDALKNTKITRAIKLVSLEVTLPLRSPISFLINLMSTKIKTTLGYVCLCCPQVIRDIFLSVSLTGKNLKGTIGVKEESKIS